RHGVPQLRVVRGIGQEFLKLPQAGGVGHGRLALSPRYLVTVSFSTPPRAAGNARTTRTTRSCRAPGGRRRPGVVGGPSAAPVSGPTLSPEHDRGPQGRRHTGEPHDATAPRPPVPPPGRPLGGLGARPGAGRRPRPG